MTGTAFMQRWRSLSFRERITWIIVLTMLPAGLYGMLLYPQTFKEMEHAENMVKRKQNRIELRASEIPELDTDTAGLTTRLKSLEQSRETLKAELAALEARFAAAGDASEQALLLDISALAQRAGLTVHSQGSAADNSTAGSGQQPAKRRDHLSKRPIVTLRVHGGYWELLDFLEGLKRLDRLSAPIGLQIVPAETPPPGSADTDGQTTPALRSTLDVTLTLTL
ncbi:MAG: hypothetical protein U5S82_18625 [Gammaproteobacteria bacterium]|nr:hypothetical protein [Gammaproteobacteria bacterium]